MGVVWGQKLFDALVGFQRAGRVICKGVKRASEGVGGKRL